MVVEAGGRGNLEGAGSRVHAREWRGDRQPGPPGNCSIYFMFVRTPPLPLGRDLLQLTLTSPLPSLFSKSLTKNHNLRMVIQVSKTAWELGLCESTNPLHINALKATNAILARNERGAAAAAAASVDSAEDDDSGSLITL